MSFAFKLAVEFTIPILGVPNVPEKAISQYHFPVVLPIVPLALDELFGVIADRLPLERMVAEPLLIESQLIALLTPIMYSFLEYKN
jgi:hypothetical protein